MSAYRWLLVSLVLAAVAFGLWSTGRARDDHTPPAPPPPVLAHSIQAAFAGTASCAGRACHGRLEPAAGAASIMLNEYTVWATQDPHGTAYATLLTPRSRQLARRLDLGPPHEAPRCLACHTAPAAVHVPDDAATAALVGAERLAGVGCAACHGNAAGWLGEHTTKSWRTRTAEAKRQRGMIDVSDPAALARQCAGCHVGAPGERDVNHDLLAAGHPRLAFEFSAFLANLPPHWLPRQRPEAAWWAVGQTVAAEAALELVRHRASTAAAPWPEFAEYDCFACHRALDGTSRRVAALPWGTWYFALPGAIAGHELPELTALARRLETPRPARAAVAQQSAAASTAMQQLTTTVAPWPRSPAFARGMMDRLLSPRPSESALGWDQAEQTYLALQALNCAAKDRHYRQALDALLGVRAFRPGWTGPASQPRGGFRAAAFFDELRDRVQRRAPGDIR
jgi:hypothetical protein